MPNDEQISCWAGDSGRHWVAEVERYDRMLQPFGDRVVAALDPQPGERILDVGCGNGALSLAVAERVGPTGHVTGVDISTPMLGRARGRAGDTGLTNVDFVEADAQVHAFEPATVDALTSRFGVMFFDDLVAAFTNLGTAVRPGGRLAFVCWRDMLVNEWIMVPATAALAHVPPPDLTNAGGPGPFTLADPDRVRSVLTEAGFTAVELEEVDEPEWMGVDPPDVIGFLHHGTFARTLMTGLDEDVEARAWAAVTEALDARMGPDGVVLSGAAWIVTATRPNPGP